MGHAAVPGTYMGATASRTHATPGWPADRRSKDKIIYESGRLELHAEGKRTVSHVPARPIGPFGFFTSRPLRFDAGCPLTDSDGRDGRDGRTGLKQSEWPSLGRPIPR